MGPQDKGRMQWSHAEVAFVASVMFYLISVVVVQENLMDESFRSCIFFNVF